MRFFINLLISFIKKLKRRKEYSYTDATVSDEYTTPPVGYSGRVHSDGDYVDNICSGTVVTRPECKRKERKGRMRNIHGGTAFSD